MIDSCQGIAGSRKTNAQAGISRNFCEDLDREKGKGKGRQKEKSLLPQREREREEEGEEEGEETDHVLSQLASIKRRKEAATTFFS
jgi:hypothetical protein